jgi:ElaB/YqjD/DUF883 family membrane-anchored ribosome-binding protein
MATNVESYETTEQKRTVGERVREIPHQVMDVARHVPEKVSQARAAIDGSVHDKPLLVTGVAAAVGLGLGVLFSRSRLGKLLLLGAGGYFGYRALVNSDPQLVENARAFVSDKLLSGARSST